MKPCIFFAEEYMCAYLLGTICSPFYVYPFPDIDAQISLRENMHALCRICRSEISFKGVSLKYYNISSTVQSMPSNHQSQCSILFSMLQYLYHNTPYCAILYVLYHNAPHCSTGIKSIVLNPLSWICWLLAVGI